MWKFSFSIWFCMVWIGLHTHAQTDSLQLNQPNSPKQKTEHKKRPILLIGLDVSKPMMSALSKSYSGVEAMVGIGTGQSVFSVHGGQVNRSLALERYSPESNGVFLGFTASRNLFADPNNAFCLGGRVFGGFWRYRPRDILLKNDLNNQDYRVEGEEVRGRSVWVEFVPALRTQVWRWIQMGFEIRLKAKVLDSNTRTSEVYHLPGYGKLDQSFAVGFNYFIYFQLFSN